VASASFAQAASSEAVRSQVTRIDGLAAVIGTGGAGERVLMSDVELRARMALLRHVGREEALGEIPEGLLQATLLELIGETLIAREALRVQAVSPSAADVSRERLRLIQQSGGRRSLSAVLDGSGASWAEIDAIARRRALVTGFLSANLEGVNVVTDAEIERAYHENSADYGGQPLAVLREQIRATLSQDAIDRAVARWVRVLSTRVAVHVFVDYEK
jgi:hypothetical protein